MYGQLANACVGLLAWFEQGMFIPSGLASRVVYCHDATGDQP
jgi:hypothetical protein